MKDWIQQRWFLLAALVLLVAGYPERIEAAGTEGVSENEPGHMVTIPRIYVPPRPTLDFNAQPWTQTACLTGFFKYGDHALADEPTWVYLCYDRRALWLGFRCERRGTAPLKTDFTDHDDRVWWDDSVEFLIADTGSQSDYYQFIVNAAGVLYDARNRDKDFEGKVDVQTASDDKGFSVIMRIPFAALDTESPRVGESWTVNFCRNSPTPERSSWSPTALAYQVPEYFGQIRFGDSLTAPIRMDEVSPMGIGANSVLLEPRPGLYYSLKGETEKRELLLAQKQPVPEDGAIGFSLADDRIHRIELCLGDREGKALARFWYPNQTPEVSDRIASLKGQFEEVTKALDQFPEAARQKASKVLADVQPVLDEAVQTTSDAGRHTPANWRRLDWTAVKLAEKLDGPSAYARTRALFPEAGFAVGLESSMRQVMIRDYPFAGRFDDHYDLTLARNEHEGFQVVVMPFYRDLQGVTVSVSPLEGPNGPAGCRAEVSLIGHVEVVDNTPYKTHYRGWWPDPLLNFQQTCDVRDDEHVAFWIDVATESATPGGLYQGSVKITAAGCKPIAIQLNVNVWDFELPRGTHLRNAFTYAEYAARRYYGDRWGKELAYKYYDFILDHRLNIDHLYRGNMPDFDVVEYGISKGMNAFNLGADFRKIGPEGPDDELDQYVARLKEKGWLDLAYVYGFDEVRREEDFKAMRKVFGSIHRYYPGLKTMTTAHDRSFGKKTGLREAVDIWVPLTDAYNLKEAKKLRAEGKKMWWYVCVVPYPPYANWFVESPAIEARLLTGVMSQKYEVDGFLYYLINSWDNNRHPVTSGPYTEWDPGTFINRRGEIPNGDGSLLCPGPDGPLSTIRLENIRDGFEDYEYLYLVAELAGRVRGLPATPARRAYLKRAETLLAVPDRVVHTVTAYTHDPQDLSAFRHDLAQAILAGKALVAQRGGQAGGQ